MIQTVISGLQIYFDRALGTNLLYRFERAQYAQVRHDYWTGPKVVVGTEKEMCLIYGAEHFLRMLGMCFVLVYLVFFWLTLVFIFSEFTTDDSTFIAWRRIGEHLTWLRKWTIGVSFYILFQGFYDFRSLFFLLALKLMLCLLGIWWKRKIDYSFVNMKVRRWHIRTCLDHELCNYKLFCFYFILCFSSVSSSRFRLFVISGCFIRLGAEQYNSSSSLNSIGPCSTGMYNA